jgi:hypothetical protein
MPLGAVKRVGAPSAPMVLDMAKYRTAGRTKSKHVESDTESDPSPKKRSVDSESESSPSPPPKEPTPPPPPSPPKARKLVKKTALPPDSPEPIPPAATAAAKKRKKDDTAGTAPAPPPPKRTKAAKVDLALKIVSPDLEACLKGDEFLDVGDGDNRAYADFVEQTLFGYELQPKLFTTKEFRELCDAIGSGAPHEDLKTRLQAIATLYQSAEKENATDLVSNETLETLYKQVLPHITRRDTLFQHFKTTDELVQVLGKISFTPAAALYLRERMQQAVVRSFASKDAAVSEYGILDSYLAAKQEVYLVHVPRTSVHKFFEDLRKILAERDFTDGVPDILPRTAGVALGLTAQIQLRLVLLHFMIAEHFGDNPLPMKMQPEELAAFIDENKPNMAMATFHKYVELCCYLLKFGDVGEHMLGMFVRRLAALFYESPLFDFAPPRAKLNLNNELSKTDVVKKFDEHIRSVLDDLPLTDLARQWHAEKEEALRDVNEGTPEYAKAVTKLDRVHLASWTGHNNTSHKALCTFMRFIECKYMDESGDVDVGAFKQDFLDNLENHCTHKTTSAKAAEEAKKKKEAETAEPKKKKSTSKKTVNPHEELVQKLQRPLLRYLYVKPLEGVKELRQAFALETFLSLPGNLLEGELPKVPANLVKA